MLISICVFKEELAPDQCHLSCRRDISPGMCRQTGSVSPYPARAVIEWKPPAHSIQSSAPCVSVFISAAFAPGSISGY